uniref:nonsense-mediated mRNA decay factor SMG7 isoform X2 n=1 Tax=Myxine glutinosa TaxID=7769 RepID=UPI00358EAEF9
MSCALFMRQAEALKADMADTALGPADVWTSRQSLQDVYQKMLVIDLEFALDKKVEQDLWNFAFKNQITSLQSQAKNRANPNRAEVQANLALFLEASSGFYTQLLQELCAVFDVDLPGRVRACQLGLLVGPAMAAGSDVVRPQPNSCLYICQHCLVHLGDIARYRNQTSQAESYYRHAAQLVPSNGQPYNQLAILASSKGDHLSSIFYYCRSIAVKFPFPAASTNLQKGLSKAVEVRDEVKVKWGLSDFVKSFVKFHGHIYLVRALDRLATQRSALEEHFKVLLGGKLLSGQQLAHLAVLNLFQLQQLRDAVLGTDEKDVCGVSPSEDTTTKKAVQFCWPHAMGLFLSFLSSMCRCAVPCQSEDTDARNHVALPAVKLSLDWLCLQSALADDVAVQDNVFFWPFLVKLLNVLHVGPEDERDADLNAPLPEEFELQGFLALRTVMRNLDFSRGHQSVVGDRDGLQSRVRAARIVSSARRISESCPDLLQCFVEDSCAVFRTGILEPSISDALSADVLGHPMSEEVGSWLETCTDVPAVGLQSSVCRGVCSSAADIRDKIETSEISRGLSVTFKQEATRPWMESVGVHGWGDLGRSGAVSPKAEPRGKRKSEVKKGAAEKIQDLRKQGGGPQMIPTVESKKGIYTEMSKTPPGTSQNIPGQVQAQGQPPSSPFTPLHNAGTYTPLSGQTAFSPQPFVLPATVAFSVAPAFPFPGNVPALASFMHSATAAAAVPTPPASSPVAASAAPRSLSPQPLASASHKPYSMQRAVVGTGLTSSPPSGPQVKTLGSQMSDNQAWLASQILAGLTKSPQASSQMPVSPAHFGGSPLGGLLSQLGDSTTNTWDSAFGFPGGPAGHTWHQRGQLMQELTTAKPVADRLTCVPSYEAVQKKNVFMQEPQSLLHSHGEVMDLFGSRGEAMAIGTSPGSRPDFCQAPGAPLAMPTVHTNSSSCRRERLGDGAHFTAAGVDPFSSFRQDVTSENRSVFSNGQTPRADTMPALPHPSRTYTLFCDGAWSPSLATSSDQLIPTSQSSLASLMDGSPPGPSSYASFGPIGTPEGGERRTPGRWSTTSKAPGAESVHDSFAWPPRSCSSGGQHTAGLQTEVQAASCWSEMGASTNLADNLKALWGNSMMQPGPSALEQLLLQQKQKQQSGPRPPH